MSDARSLAEPAAPEAPTNPIETLERSLAQAMSLAAENAAMIQQQDHTAAQATLNAAVARLLGAETK